MRYRTKAGQMWDDIAFAIYGDCRYAVELMAANAQYLSYLIFPAGIELEVPNVTQVI